jgi:hypothetical protein
MAFRVRLPHDRSCTIEATVADMSNRDLQPTGWPPSESTVAGQPASHRRMENKYLLCLQQVSSVQR